MHVLYEYEHQRTFIHLLKCLETLVDLFGRFIPIFIVFSVSVATSFEKSCENFCCFHMFYENAKRFLSLWQT